MFANISVARPSSKSAATRLCCALRGIATDSSTTATATKRHEAVYMFDFLLFITTIVFVGFQLVGNTRHRTAQTYKLDAIRRGMHLDSILAHK